MTVSLRDRRFAHYGARRREIGDKRADFFGWPRGESPMTRS